MSSPAQEAAEQAWDHGSYAELIEAAELVLKPLREFYDREVRSIVDYYTDEWSDGANFARKSILERIAPLIFTTPEVEARREQTR
jgi:hypothetical protein